MSINLDSWKCLEKCYWHEPLDSHLDDDNDDYYDDDDIEAYDDTDGDEYNDDDDDNTVKLRLPLIMSFILR